MTRKNEIIQAAIGILSIGKAVSLDSVATEVKLTKAGVMHYFPNKEALMLSLVDTTIDKWIENFEVDNGKDFDSTEKLVKYLDYALSPEIDATDFAILADLNLREVLCARWSERLDPWLGIQAVDDVLERTKLTTVRLIADGAWFDIGLNLIKLTDKEKKLIRRTALKIVDKEKLM